MELVYQRCCGIDIHKKVIVACLIILMANGQRHKEIRTFRTVTGELLQLLDWLKAAQCTHVAMESTGVYWKPIYNLLEGHFELLVVNAQHIKAVPGHKTDVRDAEWIGAPHQRQNRSAMKVAEVVGRPSMHLTYPCQLA